MANIFDVAKYILSVVGETSTMKLQKLCYYSLVESLKKNKRQPLFREKFEAWANGPVCRELFNIHRGKFTITSKMIEKKYLTDDFTKEDIKIVNDVIENFGGFTGAELSEKTHSEAPWTNARGDLSPTESCHNKIKYSDIISFYAD